MTIDTTHHDDVQTVPMTKQEFLRDLIKVGTMIVNARELNRPDRRKCLKIVEFIAKKNVTPKFWAEELEGNLRGQETAFDIFVKACEERLDDAIAKFR